MWNEFFDKCGIFELHEKLINSQKPRLNDPKKKYLNKK